MEIRLSNEITAVELAQLKYKLNKFFDTDFTICIDGEYIYLSDN